jgi:putative phosphoribosyl transferase
MQFIDRRQAGHLLAQDLVRYRDDPAAIVLALPRGGVPVAFEVATGLRVPLDVFIVRKLGLPGHEEFAMGAIASGGVMVMNPDVADFHVPQATIDAVAMRERAELDRRERLYRGDRPPIDLRDRVAVLVDDGLATGSTMLAAARSARLQQPRAVVVAVPVAAAEAVNMLRREADDVVCLETPDPFRAVGLWYRHFDQTTDDEVRELLASAREAEGNRAER